MILLTISCMKYTSTPFLDMQLNNQQLILQCVGKRTISTINMCPVNYCNKSFFLGLEFKLINICIQLEYNMIVKAEICVI